MTDDLQARLNAAMPAYAQASAILSRARTIRPIGTTRNEDDIIRAERQRLLAALMAGEDVPDDIGAPLADLRRELDAVEAYNRVVVDIGPTVQQEMRDALDAEHEAGLAVLREELAALVGEVKGNQQVFYRVHDAETALAGGLVDEYTQVRDYLARWSKIRTQQWALTKGRTFDESARSFMKFGILADAIDVLEPVLDSRRLAREPRSDSNLSRAFRAWQNAANTRRSTTSPAIETPGYIPSGEGHRWLLWACTEAHPWVPTPEQIDTVAAAVEAATYTIQSNGPASQIEALNRYYEVTGVKPLDNYPNTHDSAGSVTHATRWSTR